MLAIRQHEFGGPEELRLEELEDPQPGVGEVRIAVRAAGVHLIDTAARRGERAGPLPPATLPMTPGREVAGVVDAVGPEVDPGLVGKRVAADLGARSGGYAELTVTAAEGLHVLPDGLGFEAAVEMVGTGRTAMAILETAAPVAGDVAVVSAAAGGIGSILVQALAGAGVTVVGLAGGAEKAAVVASLGAAAAIDYHADGWPEEVRAALGERPVTLGLDGVGGGIGREVLELVGVGGRLVMYGTASGAVTPLGAEDLYSRGITVAAAISARLFQRPGGLRELESRALQAAADGTVSPLIDRFALADAAAAHQAIEGRRNVGKIVLVP
ncbi:MAG TPA: zinc-binding dehydrogenase [Solirubrobacterales bacterium]|jgi:NADPH2:quinone reductase